MKRWLMAFVAVWLAPAGFAWASPFVLDRGTTNLTLAYEVWTFDEFLDGNGDELPLPLEIEQQTFFVRFEHGVRDRLTLALTLPWAESERGALAGLSDVLLANDGVSDAQVDLKWRLTGDSAFVVSLIAGLKWPGDYATGVVNAPGDGNFDADLWLALGREWGRGALSLDAGYRARRGDPADETMLRAEGSVGLGSRVILFSLLEWVDSDEGRQIDGAFLVNFPEAPFPLTEEDTGRATAGLLLSLSDRLSLYTTYAATVEGQNTPLGAELGLGLSLSY